MPDRAAGYVTDLPYTPGYHAELNPLHTRLAFLRAGLAPPRIATACELGFGQGLSLAVHAAAGPARWWGNDLLPEHLRFAQSLEDASGAGATLAAATFEEFGQRADLPLFDFIGLHGVLSWVSPDNRARIARFVRDRLAPGGVVYTGYNALPGWVEMLPLRQLMAAHAARAREAGTTNRIEAALAFTARLLDSHPLTVRATPGLPERFERLRQADRRYLAHEYFNRDWQPLCFSDAAGLLATAGLHHAGPARLRDHLDALNLTGDQRDLLATVADPVLREMARDFLTRTQIRRDYWVRALQPLSGGALREAWHATRIVLAAPREDIAERITGPQGELRLDGSAHRAVLAALGDHRPRTVAELGLTVPGVEAGELVDAVFELAAFDAVAVAQDEADIDRCAPRTARLNARLAAGAVTPGDIGVLASPVTGGGVALNRAHPVAERWLPVLRALRVV